MADDGDGVPPTDTDSPPDSYGGSGGHESLSVPGAQSFDSIEYRPESDTYRTTFDSRLDSPSAAVVRIVAALTDARPAELDRLYDAIDPDLLDAMLSPLGSGSARGDGRISFAYHGFDITFYGSGVIEIGRLPEQSPDPVDPADRAER